VLNFNNSCLFVIDGMPLDYLLRIRRVYNSSKLIPGSDFGELFVSSSLQSRRILLIGGTNEASEIVANKMRTVGHFVVRYFEDIEIENLDSHSKYLSGLIRADNLDTIICCLGQPKQERLALKLLERNSSVTILCLGAFIDFYSQNKPRAPLLYRKFGIEWLWRLAHEPKRLWIRYAVKSPIGLILFFKYR
jgi:N-acetylglucosaminyldiphosphoundecaprenol N-acetyl-beta-D-mannosaminyltransferase